MLIIFVVVGWIVYEWFYDNLDNWFLYTFLLSIAVIDTWWLVYVTYYWLQRES